MNRTHLFGAMIIVVMVSFTASTAFTYMETETQSNINFVNDEKGLLELEAGDSSTVYEYKGKIVVNDDKIPAQGYNQNSEFVIGGTNPTEDYTVRVQNSAGRNATFTVNYQGASSSDAAEHFIIELYDTNRNKIGDTKASEPGKSIQTDLKSKENVYILLRIKDAPNDSINGNFKLELDT